jgi:hypothetical protein
MYGIESSVLLGIPSLSEHVKHHYDCIKSDLDELDSLDKSELFTGLLKKSQQRKLEKLREEFELAEKMLSEYQEFPHRFVFKKPWNVSKYNTEMKKWFRKQCKHGVYILSFDSFDQLAGDAITRSTYRNFNCKWVRTNGASVAERIAYESRVDNPLARVDLEVYLEDANDAMLFKMTFVGAM